MVTLKLPTEQGRFMVMSWLASFRPGSASVSFTERFRGSGGAFLGILLTGLISSWAVGASLALPLLIAPMGASAVLLFAVPSSPLAQPWSIIGGNTAAALIGVTAAHFIPGPVLAASVAIGFAIAAMFTLRCIHPPSGAVALTAVLGGPVITGMGYRFVLWPVLLNSIVLTVTAIGYNNATRRRYPHPQVTPDAGRRGTHDERPSRRLSFSTADLDDVLKRYDQVLDISRDDMESLFEQAEMQAYRRRFGLITCADIMSRHVVSVEWGTPLDEAWATMRKHRLRAMPVVDRAQHVLGMVTDIDFMNDAGLDSYKTLAARFHRLIQRPTSDYADRPEAVGQVMRKTTPVRSDSHIVALVPLLADSGARYVPIIDADNHLTGIVAQSDLVAALYQSSFAEAQAS
jgi:CBS domain-containing membrane protein